MLVSVYENCKFRVSSGFINIYLFYKFLYVDSVFIYLNFLCQQCFFIDVFFYVGNRIFFCYWVVLVVCSCYFEVMFSGGLKESQDSEVNFDNFIYLEVLELLFDYVYFFWVIINEENVELFLEVGDMLEF